MLSLVLLSFVPTAILTLWMILEAASLKSMLKKRRTVTNKDRKKLQNSAWASGASLIIPLTVGLIALTGR